VISGFLVTGSAVRFGPKEFAGRRILRIFPGFWVCLIVTAFLLAPIAALYENGSLRGFWGHPDGPFSYVRTNWFASMEQFPISGLLEGTPYGRLSVGPSAFDGSLWTLRYELALYGFIGVMGAVTVLRRAPRVILVLAVVVYAIIVRDQLTAPTWTIRPALHGAVGPFPLIGAFSGQWMLYLSFCFLMGGLARLYRHRLPMHAGLAVAAGAMVVLTCLTGGYLAFGLPFWLYLVLYAAVALPARTRRIGRTRDYSYGMYIYAFPIQQLIALMGGARWGVGVFILLSIAGTFVLAAPSWHLIESPSLKLKDRLLGTRRIQPVH
jgi:peptidoglycan/LPS O-acetylase OafA/YrhL